MPPTQSWTSAMKSNSRENIQDDAQHGGGEYQFTVNITPNDYSDAPIVPAEDGLLTAPDGSILTPYSLLELSQKSATTQRRQRKKTNDRNGDYIPRPPNPFILFRCWYTAKVHKPGSHDTSEGSLSSLCGQEWQNLGTQQRRIFEEAAKIEKLKHAERYPNYRYKPIHKKKQKQHLVADVDEDDARPTRSRTRRPASSHAATGSDNSVTPTSAFPLPPPTFTLPPALARHRRSSSVPPLPSEMQLYGNDMMIDQSMRPIEIPAAPFLALAGQDIPLPRRSRPSLGLGWDPTRGMSQVLTEPPIFDYTALRTSIPALPPLPNYRHRNPLPTFQNQQYTMVPQPQPFLTAFQQQESTIEWTNPNPFASSSASPNNQVSTLPQLAHGDTASSSSCSAPSPPPELEISPLDRVPGTEPYIMPQQTTNYSYPLDAQEAQPFDLNIFKRSLDLSTIPGTIHLTRQRGMSFFDDPPNAYVPATNTFNSSQALSQIPLSIPFASDYNTHNDHGYSRALNTSNILAGVPAHEDVMEGFA